MLVHIPFYVNLGTSLGHPAIPDRVTLAEKMVLSYSIKMLPTRRVLRSEMKTNPKKSRVYHSNKRIHVAFFGSFSTDFFDF